MANNYNLAFKELMSQGSESKFKFRSCLPSIYLKN